MAVRNAVPSHLRKAPCMMCKSPTAALVNGQIMRHPVCKACKQELDRQFRVASLQRARQETR